MKVLRLPLTEGFYVRTHNACRYYGYLGPEGLSPIPTTRGLTVISRGPEGFKRANPQRSKGIKSRTLRGAALSPGTGGVVPWTGGFIVGTRNEVKVIKSRTLKGGAALSSGKVGIIPGPEGLTYTPGTN